jgi:hypothetical protein
MGQPVHSSSGRESGHFAPEGESLRGRFLMWATAAAASAFRLPVGLRPSADGQLPANCCRSSGLAKMTTLTLFILYYDIRGRTLVTFDGIAQAHF